MTDKINIEFDNSGADAGMRALTSAVNTLTAALRGLDSVNMGGAKSAMETMNTTMAGMAKSLEQLVEGMPKKVDAAMKAAAATAKTEAKALAKGVQDTLDAEKPVIRVGITTRSLDLGDGVTAKLSGQGTDSKEALLAAKLKIEEESGVALRVQQAGLAADQIKDLDLQGKATATLLKQQRAAEAAQWDAYYAAQATQSNGLAADQIRDLELAGKAKATLLKQQRAAEAAQWDAYYAAQATQSNGLAADQIRDLELAGKAKAALLKEQRAAEAAQWDAYYAAQDRQARGHAADQIRDLEIEGKAKAALLRQQAAEADAIAAQSLKNRDLNGGFRGLSAQGQLTRATRVASIAADPEGEAYALRKYGSDALDASRNLAALQAEVDKLAAAKRALKPAVDNLAPSTDALHAANLKLTAGMKDAHSAARGLASGFNAMWLTWGNILPLMAGAAVSGAAAGALKMGADVGQSLATIQNLGGASTAEIQQLNRALLDTASNGPVGPVEVAKALKTMALAGLDAKDQIAALKPVLDFSVAGDLSIEKSAESLIAISTAFGYSAKDLSVVSDVVAKTAAISMASAEGMASSFKVASVVAEQYRISLTDVATTLALLSQVGIKDQAAGTATRNMYTELMGSSARAREVMQKVLKFDAFDEVTQKFKTLPEIFNGLAESLVRMTPKAQNAALAMLGNERGTKAISAGLSGVASDFNKAGESAATYMNKLRQIQAELENAPGFSAVAAIGMSGTAMNQAKATAASLQVALVDAFQAAEPAILRVNQALQGLFRSSEFKSSVETIVTTFASIVRTLVENADILVFLGKAYIAVKVGMVAYQLTVIAVSAATALHTSATVAQGIALGLTRVQAYMAAAALVALELAALPLSVVLGVVAAVAAAAAAAYYLFADSTVNAADKHKEAADNYAASIRATSEGLDSEIKRLDLIIASKGDEAKATKLQAEATRNAARENILSMAAEKKALVELSIAKAESSAQTYEGLSLIPGMSDFAAAKRRQIADLRGELTSIDRSSLRQVENMDNRFQELQDKSVAAARIAEERRRKPLPSGNGTFDPDALGGRGRSGSTALPAVPNSTALADIMKNYATEETLIKATEASRTKLLSANHSARLMSDSLFEAESAALAEEASARKLASIVATEAEYGAAELAAIEKVYADDKAWKKSHPKATADALKEQAKKVIAEMSNIGLNADAAFQKLSADRDIAKDSALTRITEQAIKAKGALNDIKTAADDFQRSQAVDDAKRARSTGYEDKVRFARPDEAVRLNAEAAETERLTVAVIAYDAEIARQNKLTKDSIDLMYEEQGRSEETRASAGAALAITKAQNAARAEARDNIKAGMSGRSERAGSEALGKYYRDQMAVSNAYVGMRQAAMDYFDETQRAGTHMGSVVTKAFKGMEDSLVEFVKTGKLDFTSLADSIISDMIRMVIQQSITAPLAQFMGLALLANGGAYEGGVQKFANGGSFTNSIVDSPTLFKFAKGTGMMGEAGPEAIMPLTRGPDGKLGVQASGGSEGGGITINQPIVIHANNASAETVGMIRAMVPTLLVENKRVIEAVVQQAMARRGGRMTA